MVLTRAANTCPRMVELISPDPDNLYRARADFVDGNFSSLSSPMVASAAFTQIRAS